MVLGVTSVIVDVSAILGAIALIITAAGTFHTARRANETKKAATETKQALDHERTPNSGTSMRDALDRIESTLATHGARLDAGVKQFEHLQARIDGLYDRTHK